MVVHDKVYDCTSFVDEHPYVFPFSHLIHIHPSRRASPPTSLSCPIQLIRHPTPRAPTLATVWYHKEKEKKRTTCFNQSPHHQHKEPPHKPPTSPLKRPLH